MIWFWKIRTNRINGSVTKTVAAIISPNGSCLAISPVNREITTGTVRAPGSMLVNVRAKRYSFHAAMKDKSPVVTKAGFVNGNRILEKVWNGVAPSTCAACISELGSPLKKEANTQVVNGRVNIRYDKIMPGIADKLNWAMTAYKPANTVTCGNMVIARITYMDVVFPLNRNLPMAKPAKEPSSREITVTETETIKLFTNPRANVAFVNTAL